MKQCTGGCTDWCIDAPGEEGWATKDARRYRHVLWDEKVLYTSVFGSTEVFWGYGDALEKCRGVLGDIKVFQRYRDVQGGKDLCWMVQRCSAGKDMC